MSEERDGAADAATEDTTAADQVTEETQAQGDEQTGDDAAAEAEGEGDKPRKPSVQERIDELTRDKHAERRRAEAAERELERLRPKPEADKPKEDPDPEPDASKYEFGETDPGYIKDAGRWAARQEFHRLSKEAEAKSQARTVEQSWAERQQTFAKEKPDYFQVLDRDWACSPPMADAIRTSEVGAAVAYHLASNPEEARRIAGLNPLAAIREIGRLEARFDTKSSGPPPKQASDAPPPPPGVRGQGGRFAVAPDTDDFAAFEKQYGAK